MSSRGNSTYMIEYKKQRAYKKKKEAEYERQENMGQIFNKMTGDILGSGLTKLLK